LEPDLSYVEHPLKVLYQKERGPRRKVIPMYKIQWNHHTEEEATWKTEHYLNQNFLGFLDSTKGIPSALWIGFNLDTYACIYVCQKNLNLNSEIIRNFQTNERTRTNFEWQLTHVIINQNLVKAKGENKVSHMKW